MHICKDREIYGIIKAKTEGGYPVKKILAAALIMLTLLCGCEKEAPFPSAAAPTLPHET